MISTAACHHVKDEMTADDMRRDQIRPDERSTRRRGRDDTGITGYLILSVWIETKRGKTELDKKRVPVEHENQDSLEDKLEDQ